MGRILEENLIDIQVDDMRERHTSDVVKNFIDLNKRCTATYLSMDIDYSTHDEGFGSIDGFIDESTTPIRHNIIYDMVLCGIEKTEFNLEYDEEKGFDMDAEIEYTILPNTIVPSEQDYFIINYMQKRIMFKCVSSGPDHVFDSNYYRCKAVIFKVIPDDFDIAKEYDIVSKYSMVEVADEYKVINMDIMRLLKTIRSIYSSMKTEYISRYYNTTGALGLFMYSSDRAYHLSNEVNHFINETDLFVDKAVTDNIYSNDLNIYSNDIHSVFVKTIYSKVLCRNIDPDMVILNSFKQVPLNVKNTALDVFSKPVFSFKFYKNDDLVNDEKCVIPVRVIDNLTQDRLVEDKHLNNLLVKYFYRPQNIVTEDNPDIIEDLGMITGGYKNDPRQQFYTLEEKDVLFLKNYKNTPKGIGDYLITPILIYILKSYIVTLGNL